MNSSSLALITPCNQGPLQGHSPLSEGWSGWIGGMKGGRLGGWWWLMWHVSSSIYTTLVHLGCQTIPSWLPALRKGSEGESGLLDLWESVFSNGKSMFHQIKTDGQGVTQKPRYLTSTNSSSRLPVVPSPLSSKLTSHSSATEKYLWSARAQPQTSFRNAISHTGFQIEFGYA